MQYSIRSAFHITAMAALLAFGIAFLSPAVFVGSCFVATIFMLRCGLPTRRDHAIQFFCALGTSTFFGLLLMASGSYNQTFNRGATGFLVGDGWNSFASSAVVGGMAGFVIGLISLLFHFVFSLTITSIQRSQKKTLEP